MSASTNSSIVAISPRRSDKYAARTRASVGLDMTGSFRSLVVSSGLIANRALAAPEFEVVCVPPLDHNPRDVAEPE
jgi:hypothetical protein